VPPGALAVSSGAQRNLPGWAQSKRAGTAQAAAAEAAAREQSHDDDPELG
jgi:bifunctional UDP-N-acetylglucosamine pyrophosphorylase/glucosamine-1-phosphate N-acetyltransferase